ncbi:MAG: Rrf2 family transcriptional regulator [Alphaproteobacteria bacterium]|jgi:Rrf2 family protein|nr:Rrf2 family transcriptional regulator [Alphaproteobacteria bacterium]MDP6564597.1 Rrf2 family transcriptional regulator [Alphaproteobacteria bacterium]MDP6814530.1 Rrf2 family transcriptional regulator [Alphaproteobacteria bacterium]
MNHFGSAVEYGLHCLLYLARQDQGPAIGTRDLAEFQGLSADYVAKLFTRLEKAGLVRATEGVRGGFHLAREAERITVLDVADALEGRKPLFECREIRGNCILFDDRKPRWASQGVCGIHAVMLRAEAEMRRSLGDHTLAQLAGHVETVLPQGHRKNTGKWFQGRLEGRGRRGARGTTKT